MFAGEPEDMLQDFGGEVTNNDQSHSIIKKLRELEIKNAKLEEVRSLLVSNYLTNWREK